MYGKERHPGYFADDARTSMDLDLERHAAISVLNVFALPTPRLMSWSSMIEHLIEDCLLDVEEHATRVIGL